MVAIPTMEEEDARRPSRERESLVNERLRIISRMKSALIRLGIRESPIQAVCGNSACTDLRGGGQQCSSLPHFKLSVSVFDPVSAIGGLFLL